MKLLADALTNALGKGRMSMTERVRLSTPFHYAVLGPQGFITRSYFDMRLLRHDCLPIFEVSNFLAQF